MYFPISSYLPSLKLKIRDTFSTDVILAYHKCDLGETYVRNERAENFDDRNMEKNSNYGRNFPF